MGKCKWNAYVYVYGLWLDRFGSIEGVVSVDIACGKYGSGLRFNTSVKTEQGKLYRFVGVAGEVCESYGNNSVLFGSRSRNAVVDIAVIGNKCAKSVSALMILEHIENVVGRCYGKLVSACKDEAMQIVTYLCYVCHSYLVAVIIEDIQGKSGYHCVSYGGLLLEKVISL